MPRLINDDCYGLNSQGFYKTFTIFVAQIFWPDGAYERYNISSTTITANRLYYRTMNKKPGTPQGDYITGFSLSEHGYISGVQAPTGSARHHTVVTA